MKASVIHSGNKHFISTCWVLDTVLDNQAVRSVEVLIFNQLPLGGQSELQNNVGSAMTEICPPKSQSPEMVTSHRPERWNSELDTMKSLFSDLHSQVDVPLWSPRPQGSCSSQSLVKGTSQGSQMSSRNHGALSCPISPQWNEKNFHLEIAAVKMPPSFLNWS